MGYFDAVRVCLAEKYADFSGRARRSEYWWFFLFNIVVSIVAAIVDAILNTGGMFYSFGLLGLLSTLALLIPGIAVGARRLHDISKSGWWLLLAFIPLVGAIILLVWFCQDSHGENEYGPSPKIGAAQPEPPYPAY